MYRPRIIPVLLMRDSGLVKSTNFKNHRYIGDPINAVKIFNDLEADELVFIDIDATLQNRSISLDFVKDVGEEANMPFSVGGGISTIQQIKSIIEAGAEKVILNTVACENPDFVKQAASEFGSSTIVICVDVKKNFWGKEYVWYRQGKKNLSLTPEQFSVQMEEAGAGEIILQSIEKDGTMLGYDVDLVRRVSSVLTIPITVLGGAKDLNDMNKIYNEVTVNGLAAGSLFVYHGERKAVLVNYPTIEEKLNVLRR
ncbi:MAG: imidazole glycerol phosphate synthase subunit HisF [Flavobacterium sp.]|nr:MAG: imidazole glycerol phosphate synthase subunit HisF [Flavobacterium sp.]